MRVTKINLKTVEIVYTSGKVEVITFTPTELAGFKRSKRYKQIITKKTIAVINIQIKTL
jgi:hypothetical protein